MWVLFNRIIPVNYTSNIEDIIEDVILEIGILEEIR
jgi:hypothetical protein